MRNQRWASGSILDQSAENLVLVWIFTLAWNVVTALALATHLVERGTHQFDTGSLLGLIFPVIGLGLIIWAGLRTRRISKFGASVFQLQTFPATPGGDLAGTIRVTQKFQPKSEIQLQLTCINRYLAGFGRNARVIDRVVWHETRTLDQLPPSDDGTDIPVLFHIPPDAQPSSDLDFRDGIRWKLEARCKTAGVSYYSQFEVPVFVADPAEVAAASRRDLLISRRSTDPVDPRSNLSERGITYEHFAGGRLRIYFGSARNKWPVILKTAIGLALCAIAIALVNGAGFSIDRIITISITTTFVCVGAAFVLNAVSNWFATDEITVRYGSLTVERQGPISLKEQTFKIKDVSDIFHQVKGGQSSNSAAAKNKSRYSLMLETHDGEVICLATDIIQDDYAAWLADEIKDTFGLVAEK